MGIVYCVYKGEVTLHYTVYPTFLGLQDQNAKIWGNMTPTKIIFSYFKFTSMPV